MAALGGDATLAVLRDPSHVHHMAVQARRVVRHLRMPLHVARSLVRAPHRSQEIELLLIMMWLIGNASNSAWNKAYLGTILGGMVPHVRQLVILRRRLWRSTCREVLVW